MIVINYELQRPEKFLDRKTYYSNVILLYQFPFNEEWAVKAYVFNRYDFLVSCYIDNNDTI